MGERSAVLARRVALVLAACAVAVLLRRVQAQQLIADALGLVQAWKGQRPVLTAVFASVLVVLWILSLMPLTPLELSIGFLFGAQVGYVVVFLGKVLGCSVAFALGRSVARQWAQRQFGKHEILRAVDIAVAREPFKICFMVRLAYIPIALKNFGLAVSPVRPAAFHASLVCVELLNSAVLVLVGSTAKDIGAAASGGGARSPGQLAATALGAVCLFALLGYLSVLTRRTLQEVRRGQGGERQAPGAAG